MKNRAAGKAAAGVVIWAGGQAVIGFTSLVTVLPAMLAVVAIKPGWKIIVLAAGTEILSHWPPGVVSAAVFFPWILSKLVKPGVDLSFRFFGWCGIVAILQLAWLAGWETSSKSWLGIPWLWVAWIAVFSAGLVFTGAIWIRWHYPRIA